MLKNYIKIAFRSISRRPVYTFLNIAGLSAGMAVCLLAGLYVHDEWKTDRFHEHANRIVQIAHESQFFDGRSPSTPYPLASVLKEEVPGVTDVVRIFHRQELVSLDPEGTTGEFRVLNTEESFFTVFSFTVVRGSLQGSLNSPGGILISESMARLFFDDDDPLGQELHVGEGPDAIRLTIRGVVEDAPAASTIQYDFLVSLSLMPESWRRPDGWGASVYATYALLESSASLDGLNTRLQAAINPHFAENSNPPLYFVVPFTSVYLSDLHRADGFRGQMRYLYIFGFAAVFVLLIAGINYINLSTALGARRAREIGVRKTMGADRYQLIRQFLAESVLLSLASLLVALTLIEIAFPFFNHLFETELSLLTQPGVLVVLAIFVLLTGIAAGSYPAFVLSAYNPAANLNKKTMSSVGGSGRLGLRQVLVVFQFAISSVLIIGILTISYQLYFMQTTDLGFDGEQVVIVNISGNEASGIREDIRRQIEEHSGVVRAATATAVPGGQPPPLMGVGPGEISPTAETVEETIWFRQIFVDPHFFETLGISLLAGEGFSTEVTGSQENAYILNETAISTLGWNLENAVGQPFGFRRGGPPFGEVTGVVRDFHLSSLHQEISPVILQFYEGGERNSRLVFAAKLSPDKIPEALQHIEQVLAPILPASERLFRFLDDQFHELYHAEQRLSRVVTAFAILSILIACFGLFGLVSFATETRTKEIGIRKVLGASVAGIVALLSKDFLKLVLIGFVIASPIAWYAMNRWLEEFAYRIEIGPGVFLLAGVAAILIALLTVSWQSVKAAVANPVESLRSE